MAFSPGVCHDDRKQTRQCSMIVPHVVILFWQANTDLHWAEGFSQIVSTATFIFLLFNLSFSFHIQKTDHRKPSRYCSCHSMPHQCGYMHFSLSLSHFSHCSYRNFTAPEINNGWWLFETMIETEVKKVSWRKKNSKYSMHSNNQLSVIQSHAKY